MHLLRIRAREQQPLHERRVAEHGREVQGRAALAVLEAGGGARLQQHRGDVVAPLDARVHERRRAVLVALVEARALAEHDVHDLLVILG